MPTNGDHDDGPPGGDPNWWKGVGLYVELHPIAAALRGIPEGEPDLFFAPLPDNIYNVDKWVRDTLADEGFAAPPTDQLAAMVANIKSQKEHPASTIKRERFDLTRTRPAEWLWEDRVYLGGFNILLGREGIGKGTLASWLITQLALGKLPGKFEGTPTNVAIIGSEDDYHSVWAPRIIAAALESGLTVEEAEQTFDGRVFRYTLPDGSVPNLTDAEEIARAMHEDDVKLVYFDSLLDSLRKGTDPWKDSSTRDALQPAKWLGEQLEASVVGSLHPNKRGGSFDQIVSGARAFNAVSRSSLMLEEHPKNEDLRVLLRGKGNYSAEPDALEWTLAGKQFDLNGETFSMPIVRGIATSTTTEEELMQRFSGEPSEEGGKSKVQIAAEYMEGTLADGEPQPVHQHLAKLAELECESKSTLSAARKRAHVTSFQKDGAHWWQKVEPSQSQS